MSNIKSTDISIFPLAKPRLDNTSRLFYEQNVTNLLRQLMDTDGFIIQDCEINNTESNKDLIFNLYGYYFKIKREAISTILSTNLNNGEYIIAKIKLTQQEPIEIDGQDDNDLYTGLEIICNDTIPQNNDSNSKTLVLFEKVNNEWKPYNNSLNKFNSQSLSISGIDGKPKPQGE